MGSMHTGLEETKNGFEKMAAYFSERARGQVGLIVTGGIAPSRSGWVGPFSAKLTNRREAKKHRLITEAVHREGGKICLQILHAGRYGYHPLATAPSAIKSPISPFKPWKLTKSGVNRTIRSFERCAKLAQEAGYDGVEIMGSEGYLINQFIAKRTNKRTDEWGGSFENRIRFPLEIIRRVRAAVGEKFILIYRLSMLDLVEEGSTWEEVVQLAQAVEEAGATIINTGIGWHEARVPTIATMVPRGGFSWVTQRLMDTVSIPLITTNRINTPEVAEKILADGHAQMVSMARPFLADPDFVRKAMDEKSDEINTCIACNQACLDHIFSQKTATCLVNPRAARETELNYLPTQAPKKIAVVGAGPAGLSAATIAASRGHEVHLFEKSDQIGGQFNLAKQIPGKEEFYETIRYFKRQLELTGVQVHYNTTADVDLLKGGQFNEVILATGVRPRRAGIPGEDLPQVLTYLEVLRDHQPVGKSVAVIGAGGIGFDVSDYLTHGDKQPSLNVADFTAEWGIDTEYKHRGALQKPQPDASPRKIWLLQRSDYKPGAKLGKTTGWIHRANLKKKGVVMLNKCTYERIDDQGLHIQRDGKPQTLAVDTIVICAGQLPNAEMKTDLAAAGINVHLIGGSDEARQLDAQRAIRQGAELAARL